MTTTTHDTARHSTQVNLYTLGHHLRIAQEQYLNHAQVMDEAGDNFHPVRDQFRSMAQECETLAGIFQHENVRRLMLSGDNLMVRWSVWSD